MSKSRIHIVIHGRVQGVFYRYNAQKKAKKFGLTGWVRNNPDKTVEIVAEGEKFKLKQLFSEIIISFFYR